MGEHKGWTVAPQRSGKWLARVKVPGPGRYESKSFPADEKRQATEWARTEAAVRRLGVDPRRSTAIPTLPLLTDYVARLRDLRRSESHAEDVERRLRQLALALPDLAAPGATDTIERWLRALAAPTAATPALSPATRNKILVQVRGFCRWAVRRGKLPTDPTAALDRVAVPAPLPAVFTFAELQTLIAPTDDAYHRQFALMLYSGLRAQEAACLHWEDFDWSGDVILLRLRAGVRIKREKERLVPLQPELRQILELPWPAIPNRIKALRSPTDHTPAAKRRGPLFNVRDRNTHRGLGNFLLRHGVAVDERSPHACRHTYGCLMTASGVPSLSLMAYMGHSSVATTAIYTRLALHYETVARTWQRGQFRLLPNAIPGAHPAAGLSSSSPASPPPAERQLQCVPPPSTN